MPVSQLFSVFQPSKYKMVYIYKYIMLVSENIVNLLTVSVQILEFWLHFTNNPTFLEYFF